MQQSHTNNLYFSERLNFLDNSFEDYNEIDCAHPYFKILFLFINFGVKKKIGPYINGFKKIYDLIKSKNVNITKLSYHDEILLYFCFIISRCFFVAYYTSSIKYFYSTKIYL